MTVSYSCEVNAGALNDFDYNLVTGSLDRYGYEWSFASGEDGGKLIIEGEMEVDDYDMNAGDVADEIKNILWNTAEYDVDVETREVEHEPDWDAMPGGYDYGFWN